MKLLEKIPPQSPAAAHTNTTSKELARPLAALKKRSLRMVKSMTSMRSPRSATGFDLPATPTRKTAEWVEMQGMKDTDSTPGSIWKQLPPSPPPEALKEAMEQTHEESEKDRILSIRSSLDMFDYQALSIPAKKEEKKGKGKEVAAGDEAEERLPAVGQVEGDDHTPRSQGTTSPTPFPLSFSRPRPRPHLSRLDTEGQWLSPRSPPRPPAASPASSSPLAGEALSTDEEVQGRAEGIAGADPAPLVAWVAEARKVAAALGWTEGRKRVERACLLIEAGVGELGG
ncbi:Hypothetical protein D9617_1g079540 [Elsinoe fawcettii]|nr:Hypothetical protein D9617_1g079540 [Elsinoe fawcettii]